MITKWVLVYDRIYTGGEDAEFVYAIGPQTAVYIAKFDAKTLELLQKIDLGKMLLYCSFGSGGSF